MEAKQTKSKESEFEDFEGEESLSKEAQESLEKKNTSNDEDTYPYKNINIGKDNLSAFQLYRKFKNGIIKLDPEFQREGDVWNPKQKSELIESILIGIPLPILYVKEDKQGNWILIDGRQRLSTIFDFMDNKFALSNLTILKKSNNYKFKLDENDLSIKTDLFLNTTDVGKIEDVNLTLHVIKEPTPEKLTYDLFDRVNRGGTRLNNQEMRNAIYQGTATRLIKVLSKLRSFKQSSSHISPARMKDRYLVLRFVSFYLWKKGISRDLDSKDNSKIEYKSDLEDFLAKSMIFLNSLEFETVNNDFDDLYIDEHRKVISLNKKTDIIVDNASDLIMRILYSFDTSMKSIFESFGGNSFRLPKKDSGVIRPINMALFEVITYFFIELESEFIDNKELVIREYYRLLDNVDFLNSGNDEDDFTKSLTYIVDSNKSVNRRFDIIDKKIKFIKDYVKDNQNTKL